MPDSSWTARRLSRRAVAGLVVFVLCFGLAVAQTVEREPPPEGIVAGPVVFQPSLTTGYAYDSNLFLRSAHPGCDPNTDPNCFLPVSDLVLTVQPTILLTVPFSNSRFQFGDTLNWVKYHKTPQVNGNTSNEAFAELDLKFSTFDVLTFSARHIAGVAETLAFDPGGEVVFAGQSYRLHTETLSLARVLDGERGYRFALTRNVLNFDQQQEVSFFNYSGFDGEAAYLQPLSSNTRLSFGYIGARYNHYDVSPGSDPYQIARTETGDTVYGTIEGRLGPRQPYLLRLGWERLAFSVNSPTGFQPADSYSQLVWQGTASFIVGGGTVLSATLQRQPYRSFFEQNSFYLYDVASLGVQRMFPSGATIGGNLSFGRNAYQHPVTISETGAVVRRSDRTILGEAYATLPIRERVAFRISIRNVTRTSNYPGVDYDDTVVFGGIVLGWF